MIASSDTFSDGMILIRNDTNSHFERVEGVRCLSRNPGLATIRTPERVVYLGTESSVAKELVLVT